MRVQSIMRGSKAFQQPLSVLQIESICARVLPGSRVERAVELGLGTYNSTYRLDLLDHSVVLRVAPSVERLGYDETVALRNEYAAAPYLAGLGSLTPRGLAADFTRELLDRDYLVQSLLPGEPAPDVLDRVPRPGWDEFYRQLGHITRRIHDVGGDRFGSVAGPAHDTWSQALIAQLDHDARLYRAVGLDPVQVEAVSGFVSRSAELFDVIEPRLLHGDLWHANVLLTAVGDQLTISGVCDSDRASWGDPWADWTIEAAGRRPGTERDAFWDTYGPAPTDDDSRTRQLVYRSRNQIGSRLDIRRRGLATDEIPAQHWDLRPTLTELGIIG